MATGFRKAYGPALLFGSWAAQALLAMPLWADDPAEAELELPAASAAKSDDEPGADSGPSLKPIPADDGEVIISDRPSARRSSKTADPAGDSPSDDDQPLQPIPAGSVPKDFPSEPKEFQSSASSTKPPSVMEAKSLVMRAYQLTKTADTDEDYTIIIDACHEGLRAALSKDTAAYARKLKAWAHNRRGESRIDDDEQDAALEDFNAAIELDANHWRALHNRGVTFAMMGKYDEAIGDFDRTVQLNPNYANAYFNRGELLYELGEYRDAIEDYNDSIRLSPNDSAAYNSRGHSYYRLEKFREAVADYTEAIKINPDNAAALTNRGDIYCEIGNYEQAGTDYRAAIKANPALGRAYQSAAWLMATCPNAKFRNIKLAVEAAKKAIDLDGDTDFRYLETLAAAHASAGDYDSARQAQSQALQAVPKSEFERSEKRLDLYKKSVPYREAPRQAARTNMTPPKRN